MRRLIAAAVLLGGLSAGSAEAGVSWIDIISNRTNHDFTMWVKDSSHEGIFYYYDGPEQGEYAGKNDGGRPFVIKANTRYDSEWTGIPWYWKGRHRRTIMIGNHHAQRNPPGTYGLEMWQSWKDGKDYIDLRDVESGDEELIEIPGGDRRYDLVFFCRNDRHSQQCKKQDVGMELVLIHTSADVESVAYGVANSERFQALLDKISNALIDGAIEAAKAGAVP